MFSPYTTLSVDIATQKTNKADQKNRPAVNNCEPVPVGAFDLNTHLIKHKVEELVRIATKIKILSENKALG